MAQRPGVPYPHSETGDPRAKLRDALEERDPDALNRYERDLPPRVLRLFDFECTRPRGPFGWARAIWETTCDGVKAILAAQRDTRGFLNSRFRVIEDQFADIDEQHASIDARLEAIERKIEPPPPTGTMRFGTRITAVRPRRSS